MATHTAMAQGSNASMRNSLEKRLGIIHFVSSNEHGWSGQSRTRFTDFQVNEITKDGEVVHLNDFYSKSNPARAASQSSTTPAKALTSPLPNKPTQTIDEDGVAITDKELAAEEKPVTVEQSLQGTIADSDKAALVELLGQKSTDELMALYTNILQNSKPTPDHQRNVSIPSIADKSQRSRVHAEIRRIFSGKIDTIAGSDGIIKATAVRGGNRARGNRSTNTRAQTSRQDTTQGSGQYLHFSLYKENKDTMDALNHLAKTLRIHPKAFGAAGTKDRRAVTVQRVSIKGRSPASLTFLNERLNNVKIGDFKYAPHPIRLNDHDGNEFVIVLKNCVFSGTEHLSFDDTLAVAKSTIDSALTQVIQHGFINYYGTQRFGTHQIGTQEVGMKILQEDFSGAIQALLSYDPLLLQDLQEQDNVRGAHRDDISRARACAEFLETKDAKAALEYLPPRCHVEKTIIQHLGKNPTDFVGALMSINRSMRTMYGHAYQSLVWNFVASKRWERFGAEVTQGDLVLAKSKSAATDVRGGGEEASLAWEEDITTTQSNGLVPHVVTEDDLQHKKYTIYDVVLPSPGWDVVYPPNEIGDFYVEFMGKPENGGLDPHNMRRRQRDFSLPGSYRKLMGKLKRIPTASVQAYSSDLEQLVPTDLDIIRSRKSEEKTERDAHAQNATTAWQLFKQDVRQNELDESRANTARRQAEAPMPTTRINDTWIQTSVDGSNKRVRIAKDPEVITIEPESVRADGTDTIDLEDNTLSDKLVNVDIDTAVVNQPNVVDETQTQQLTEETLTSPAIATNTTDEAEPTNTTTTISTGPIDPMKIAVILRFALDTSQYATIVLRELQGAPLADDRATQASE